MERFKIDPKWSRTKEEIWAEHFAMLDDEPARNTFRWRRWQVYAAAAVILLLLALPLTAFFYTEDYNCPRGEHLALSLPDGSSVTLNAESSLRFKPYWWFLSRKAGLNGEAYFDVEKGRKFKVSTPNGSVSVLGTSFNVFSRQQDFKVLCLSGKVKVETDCNRTVLNPAQEAYLKSRKLVVRTSEFPEEGTEWMNGNFYFENASLESVLQEIERQYNINIKRPEQMDYHYTGNFSKERKIEEVLKIVGTPFALNLELI